METQTSQQSGGQQSGRPNFGGTPSSESKSSAGDSKGEMGQDHTEGSVARAIEQQTAKLPSDLFLWGAAGVIGVSAVLQFTGHKDKSRFVGQWVAPVMLLGIYNKLVKQLGSDGEKA